MRDDDAMKVATRHQCDSDGMSRRQFGTVAIAAGFGSLLPIVGNAAHSKEPAGASRNVELFRHLIERGFNQGDLTVVDEIVASNYKEHEYLAPTDLSGPETVKSGIRITRKLIANLKITVEDIAVSGDRVWARLVCRGQDPGTGKPIEMTAMDVSRFEDHKMVEHWGVPDRFALLHQLGLLPPGLT
jgi:predicted SnoaL-like aldol condensation-catalyzing enzyme